MSVPAAYLGIVLIWSTTPLAIQWSSEGAGFLFGLAARMSIGILCCLLLLKILRTPMPFHRKALETYAVAGFTMYFAMMCVYWGAQFIPSGLVSVLYGLTPLVTGLLAAWLLQEQTFTPSKLFGLATAIAGLALVFGKNALAPLHGQAAWGILAVLGSVTAHSAGAVIMKRIGTQLPTIATATGGLAVAVPLYMLTWAIFDGAWPQHLPLRTASAIVYLGLIGSALGFILYFYALKHSPASHTALINLVTPVLALLLGHTLNRETVTVQIVAGTSLILGGLVFYHAKMLRTKPLLQS